MITDLKNGWRTAPVTTIILIATVVVYILMTLAGGTTNNQVLFEFGAKWTPAIRAGQYWRLITPVFEHIGLTHLVMNGITIYFLGIYIESLFGHWRMAVIYFFSGFTGNLLSAVWSPHTLSAGASTAIFGLFGAFLMLGENFRDYPAIHALATEFLVLVVLNIFTDLFTPGIDLAGHLGGLAGGFLIAYVLGAPKIGSVDLIKRFIGGTILIVGILMLLVRLG